MKLIPLTRGYSAIVDDDMFETLSKYKWKLQPSGERNYASRSGKVNGKQKTWFIHWDVIGKPPKKYVVDHINGNPLDNRKDNLRICTIAGNSQNAKISKLNTSGCKGVDYHVHRKGWRARITVNNKRLHVGYYKTKDEAIKGYIEASKKLHAEFSIFVCRNKENYGTN